MFKKITKIIQDINFILNKVNNLEKEVKKLKESQATSNKITRSYIIRILRKEQVNENIVLSGKPYNDISPIEASNIINNPNENFILLDVTSKDFPCENRLHNALHIPFEEIKENYNKISNMNVNILVISEDGVKSIEACKYLSEKGFYNLTNISGGYSFLQNKKSNYA